jgi:hypothetical protein
MLYVRLSSLLGILDQRLWRTDSAAHTDVVIAAAASAKCSFSNGFDVDDLVARARAIPRPQLKRIDERGLPSPCCCAPSAARGGESRRATPIDPTARRNAIAS